jgi:hypothetical protein
LGISEFIAANFHPSPFRFSEQKSCRDDLF